MTITAKIENKKLILYCQITCFCSIGRNQPKCHLLNNSVSFFHFFPVFSGTLLSRNDYTLAQHGFQTNVTFHVQHGGVLDIEIDLWTWKYVFV